MQKVNNNSFKQEVIDSDIPVLVDFSAEWCGPCKMVAPVLESLSREYEGKVKFVKVDVDESGALAQQFRVMGVPSMFLIKGGEIVDKKVGYADKNVLSGMIDAWL